MAKEVTSYEANDGSLFKTEREAKEHEFKKALEDWFKANVEYNPTLSTNRTAYFDKIMEKRQELLAIFKLLNGLTPEIPPAPEVSSVLHDNGAPPVVRVGDFTLVSEEPGTTHIKV
jgi:hypothetical protein